MKMKFKLEKGIKVSISFSRNGVQRMRYFNQSQRIYYGVLKVLDERVEFSYDPDRREWDLSLPIRVYEYKTLIKGIIVSMVESDLEQRHIDEVISVHHSRYDG